MATGDRIKAHREALGISADKLAEAIGKNRATVYRYENGFIDDIPVSVISKIADVLGTTPAYLMGWSDNPSRTPQLHTKEVVMYQQLSAAEVFHALLYCAGFSEALDDDANWTVYKDGVCVDMHEEKVNRIMEQTLQYFTYLVERER